MMEEKAMINRTPAYGLPMPEENDNYSLAVVNEVTAKVDEALGMLKENKANAVDVESSLSTKANVLTSSVTVYVAPAGSDTTGNGTSANPYATVGKALSTLPLNLNGYTAYVEIADGTYTQDIRVEYFTGGQVLLDGNNVTINHSGAGAAITIHRNTYCYLAITSLTVNCNNANTVGVSVSGGNCLVSGNITINGTATGITGLKLSYGANLSWGNAANWKINNCANGIGCYSGSTAAIWNTSGTGNTVCYRAENATILVATPNMEGTTKLWRSGGGQVLTGSGVTVV